MHSQVTESKAPHAKCGGESEGGSDPGPFCPRTEGGLEIHTVNSRFGILRCHELEELQIHLALVLEVVGQVDRGHAALAELTLYRVTAF